MTRVAAWPDRSLSGRRARFTALPPRKRSWRQAAMAGSISGAPAPTPARATAMPWCCAPASASSGQRRSPRPVAGTDGFSIGARFRGLDRPGTAPGLPPGASRNSGRSPSRATATCGALDRRRAFRVAAAPSRTLGSIPGSRNCWRGGPSRSSRWHLPQQDGSRRLGAVRPRWHLLGA